MIISAWRKLVVLQLLSQRFGLDLIEVARKVFLTISVNSQIPNQNEPQTTASSTTVGFAREVISIIPDFLDCKNVLGIGEIGLNKNSKNELIILEEQLALAERLNQLVLVHTPHLEDKLKGTILIMDAIENTSLDPSRVLIDHVEEHTVHAVLDRGFWAGMTLYPDSKCTPQRAADIIEMHGTERLWINSAGDWGPSDPLAVPKCCLELASRGHSKSLINTISYDNPLSFLSQSGKFSVE